MGIKVCKFGGTSMADGNIILRAAQIVQSDKDRRFVVVSAPGKRFNGDIKVTDLLYKCADALDAGDSSLFEETFDKISTRFLNIERELEKDVGMQAGLNQVKAEMFGGAGRDYCASRGEYFAAKIKAAGCFLPLTQKTSYPKEYGTRHRAAIGITEVANVVSLVVSEETGIISIIKQGAVTRYADYDMLVEALKDYYWQEMPLTAKKNNGGNKQ